MGNGCSCSQSVKVSPQNPPFPHPESTDSNNNNNNNNNGIGMNGGQEDTIGALLRSTLGPPTSPSSHAGGSPLTSRRSSNGSGSHGGASPNALPSIGRRASSSPPGSLSPQEAQLHNRLSAQLGGRPPPPPPSPPRDSAGAAINRQDSGSPPPPPLQLRGGAPVGIGGGSGGGGGSSMPPPPPGGLAPLQHKPVLPGLNSSSSTNSSSRRNSNSNSNNNNNNNNNNNPSLAQPKRTLTPGAPQGATDNDDTRGNHAAAAAAAAASADDGTVEGLPWPVGTIVELKGLKSDAFNGLGGEVLQLDLTALRYVCRISSGHVTKIKPENLLKLEGAAAQHVREEMKANDKTNVPMRAARRSSYDFVVDHCLLEKEAVLANTRRNAETKVEGTIPKVDQNVPATPKVRKLTFNDGILEDKVFGPGLRNVQEFDQGTPIKFMMAGSDDDDGGGGGGGGGGGRGIDDDLPPYDDNAGSPVSPNNTNNERPTSAGSGNGGQDPYDFSYLSNA